MVATWDVDRTLMASYCFADVPSPSMALLHDGDSPQSRDGGQGTGLEPEDGEQLSWQDTFSQLEEEVLSSSWMAPYSGAPRALHGMRSGAANRRVHHPPAASHGLQLPPAPVALPECNRSGASSERERSPKRAVRGQTTADMGNGMNMDKRRCRQLHRDDFMAAISTFRETLPEPVPLPPSTSRPSQAGGVTGWVRKRPLLETEKGRGEYDAVTVAGSTVTTHCCLMKPDLRRMFLRHSAFEPSGGAFDESATSSRVYASALRSLVELALTGGRGTLIMYGQTGSGKTMSLAHLQEKMSNELFGVVHESETDGVEGAAIHRDTVCTAPDNPTRCQAAAVEVTAVEVMGRRCRQLPSGKECQILQTAQGGATVKGADAFVATSAGELVSHLLAVLRSRSTEATAVNSTSSRSHAIITLRVGNDNAPEGRLTLLDCAGSEWSADSDAHDARRRRECSEINASLHALKQCVRAHADKLRQGGKGHVPYRDAALTRLLRDSFEADGGPECRLVMVGCVSPGAADVEHTTSTLRTVMELSGAKREKECTVSTQPVPRLKRL